MLCRLDIERKPLQAPKKILPTIAREPNVISSRFDGPKVIERGGCYRVEPDHERSKSSTDEMAKAAICHRLRSSWRINSLTISYQASDRLRMWAAIQSRRLFPAPHKLPVGTRRRLASPSRSTRRAGRHSRLWPLADMLSCYCDVCF
jgi:hypothetical protein